ncbi:MAG: potassium-transporting ATPase subunit KdpA [Anaerolineae bacterium]|nr:potassium-transporting ATPase subunit KdpA [Anaerolineae bacterium]
MTFIGILQIVLYIVVLVALTKPLGAHMARVYQGEKTFLDPLLRPVERFLYRLFGTRETDEMDWKTYAMAVLMFSAAGLVFLYTLQRAQGFLPLNPQAFGAVTPDSSFNTASSFVTNTNWQGYAGETTMSYLTQMLGMTVQNFVSAATGMAVLVAFIRGLTRHNSKLLGNFWVDLTRSTLYILLPLAILVSLLIISQGAVQSLASSTTATLVEPTIDSNGATVTTQTIAVGPAASQVAIKHLGTNGGGFFNANAAHPFESPTPLTDFVLILAESVIAAALCYTFGKMVGDTRQGWAILAAMVVLLVTFMFVAYWAEAKGNPAFAPFGVDQTASDVNPGGNMEGKEVRFGIARSALFATATTATSTGAVNSMHDSYMPMGGFVPLFMMQLGEVVLGGVGSGLYGMLVFVIVAVFIAGLMVGRTPEYLGKKIEPFEMKMAALLILIMPLTVLGMTAFAVVHPEGLKSISNPGAHGFSQVLYAFTSQGNNNGSAFAGLGANTLFYNTLGGLAMLISRFWLAVPTLALAGSLARKKHVPASAGTLPTYSPLFIGWLIAVVLIVGALNFLPGLALGPVVEQVMMK